MVDAKAVPPVAAAYHNTPVPVAVKLAIVGVIPEQNDCIDIPVGGDVTVSISIALPVILVVPPVLVPLTVNVPKS